MKSTAKCALGTIFLLFLSPPLIRAQHLGQITCTRADGYTYLYSSITTMDVVRTLQCGEQVEVLGRYEGFFSVRTAKGENGFVGDGTLVLLKDKPSSKPQLSVGPAPARPRTAYDAPAPAPPPPNPVPTGFDLTPANGTPIHLKLGKTLSSETAHVGDVVDFVVVEDVVVDGLCVIPSGASATGVVSEAEPKKRMGRGGKLGLSVNSVRLADNEKAAARSYQESAATTSTAGSIMPLAHGKEVVFPQGTEITAYVDGNIYLKRASFQPPKNTVSPAPVAQNPSQPN